MQTQLKKTAMEFRRWRKQRTGPIAAAPAQLQRDIVKLLEQLRWDEVCRTVGVSRSLLGNWRKAHCDDLQLRPRKQKRAAKQRPAKAAPKTMGNSFLADFIEVAPVAPTSALEVEMRFSSGTIVQARTTNDPQALGDFVTRVLASSVAQP